MRRFLAGCCAAAVCLTLRFGDEAAAAPPPASHYCTLGDITVRAVPDLLDPLSRLYTWHVYYEVYDPARGETVGSSYEYVGVNDFKLAGPDGGGLFATYAATTTIGDPSFTFSIDYHTYDQSRGKWVSGRVSGSDDFYGGITLEVAGNDLVWRVNGKNYSGNFDCVDGTCRRSYDCVSGTWYNCSLTGTAIHVDGSFAGEKCTTSGWGPRAEQCPFNNVGEAVDFARNSLPDGWEIKIRAGSYPEAVAVDKDLTLTGSGGTANIGEVWGTNPHRNLPYFHKGQTHAHANVCCWWPDDGECGWGVTYCEGGWGNDFGVPADDPRELEEAYRDAGFDFIALTHHQTIIPDPNVPGILHINGEEDGDWDSPYDPPHIIGVGITHTSDDDWSCQYRINHFIGQDGLAIIAHPSNEDMDFDDGRCVGSGGHRLKDNYGYTGAEINNDVDRMFFDNVWSAGGMTWGVASDDCHNTQNPSEFHQGWVMVNSDRLQAEKDDIIRNMREGNFFAQRSAGRPDDWIGNAPLLHLETDQKSRSLKVKVTSLPSATAEIRFLGSGQRVLKRETLATGQESAYLWTGHEGGFVRVEAEDNLGSITYSQPIKCRKLEGAETLGPAGFVRLTDPGVVKVLGGGNVALH